VNVLKTLFAIALFAGPIIYILLHMDRRIACIRRAAHRLNLTGAPTMFVDQKTPFSINPTTDPKDGSTPQSRPVTDVVWRVADTSGNPVDGASINTTTPDLYNAELVCDVPATLFVSVEAKNEAGVVLTDGPYQVVVEAIPVFAEKLNLAAGEPQPRA
jgi:hypothetical protein